MRLLIADAIDTQPLEELRLLGIEIVVNPNLTRDTLPAALAGVGILVVRRLEVTKAALEGARELNLIVRAGGGSGNIDVESASERGIYVANCPNKNASAVAELVMGLTVALDRRILEAHAALREGRWERGVFGSEQGLWGRHIGIAGLGATGREVLARARVFGMKPHVMSRAMTAQKAQKLDVAFAPTLEHLASVSEVFTVHLPLTPSSRGVVSKNVLEALPDDAIVINTAHAALFDLDALAEIAPRKRLRVGLDVHTGEPRDPSANFDARFANLPNVICTPHVGGSTKQAQRAISDEITRVIRCFLTEENVPNVINVCATTPARYVIVLRQLDKVGALANTLAVLKRHGINIEEISNTVFDGAKATCTKLRVSGRPSDGCLKEIAAFDETLHVDIIQMPNRA